MAISLRTLQRWQRQFAGDGGGGDRRKGSTRHVAHRLSHKERQQILAVCNEPQYASLPPAQIVPALADQGEFLASESSFYRVLHAHQQVQHRGRARSPQQPRPVPRRRADGPNQLWSWDITYLPTSVRGVWLYLYLVVDVWSGKIVAWDIAEREEAQVAADLISRACLRERISKQRQRRLVLHADNGAAMRAATLEVRLEELGGSALVLQAPGVKRQPLLRGAVPHRQIPVRLPEPALFRKGGGLPVGGGIRGLVRQ